MKVVHYRDRRGREPVSRYLLELRRHGEASAAAALLRMIDLLVEHGPPLGMPLDRLIDRRARVYELRPGDHRVAYAEAGGEVVLLHAWRKRTQQLDRQELGIAVARLDDWLDRRGGK